MLPELWENIFDMLSGRQLLDVVLVCKEFKEIVESSSRLMGKLNLVLITSQSDENLLRSMRKYKNLSVDGVDEKLEAFLCNQTKNIENLKVSNCKVSTSALKRSIYPISHNIRVLSLCDVKLIANTSMEKTKTNYRRLEKLHLLTTADNTCINVLKIFHHEKLREFVYMSDCDVDENEVECLMRFLISQEKLTSLCLVGVAARKLMMSEKFANATRFSLESFWVELDAVDEGFLQFLMSHKETLKVLNVENLNVDGNFVNLLADFNQLTSLRLSNCSFASNQNFSSNAAVKEVLLHKIDGNLYETEICCFLRSVRTEKLNLSSMDITFNVALTMAYDMENLIHLSLDKCDLNPITLSNIKRLKCIEMERAALLRLIQVNRHIKYLEVAEEYQSDPDVLRAINKLNFCKTVKFR